MLDYSFYKQVSSFIFCDNSYKRKAIDARCNNMTFIPRGFEENDSIVLSAIRVSNIIVIKHVEYMVMRVLV